jgi:ABC-2 type transport system ATP-binding protein
MHGGRVVTSGTVAEVIADRPARISFDLPEQPGGPSLLPLPGAEVGFTGRRVTIRTRRLQQTLTELLRWAEQQHVELAGLDARSASLEEAFLAIAADAPAESTPALTGAGR